MVRLLKGYLQYTIPPTAGFFFDAAKFQLGLVGLKRLFDAIELFK